MNTQVLIIGSGGAGLSAALHAKQAGAKVIVASKTMPTNGQTCMAQGGINASFESSEVEAHISDTMRSSHGLASQKMVEMMCQQSSKALNWLVDIGVAFSRDEQNNLEKRFMGGASLKRTYYAQDYTGLKILHTLYDQSLKEEIEFRSNYFFLNLIVHEQRVEGATFLDISNGEVVSIEASSVVLATGGYSGVYHGFTTNGYGSSGDAIVAVVRAGGVVSDLEFVQFHPTALKNSSILISEAARGEGGYILNSDNQRFVDELLPRDVVARAIAKEIESGKNVFLDLRHLGAQKIQHLLPQEYKLCKLHEGIDMTTQLVPIKPVAHYTMGGIEVDLNLEVSGIKGCFAVGECSNAHIHGANRLGGNSLLEIIAMGKIAGENAVRIKPKEPPQNSTQLQNDKRFIAGVYNFTNQINFYEKREFLGKILYHNAGILRNDTGLKAGLAAVRQMQKEFSFMGIGDKSKTNNTNLVEFVEFGNTLEVVEMLLVGALHRNESRGAHFREDFNEENETFKAHSIFWKEDGVLCANFKGIK